MSVNKVILLGRLGGEPELKYTPAGNSVCSFSLATSEQWKDKEGKKQERTEWHRVVIWGKLAELASQYLNKGHQVYLEGKNQTRKWDDKNGVTRYTTEVLVSNLSFLPNGERGPSKPPQDTSVDDRMADNSAFGGTKYSDPHPPAAYEVSQAELKISKDPGYTADDIPF